MIMSSTKHSGTGIAFRTSQPEQFLQDVNRLGSTGSTSPPAFLDVASPGMVELFCDQFRLSGIDIGQEEFHELKELDQFLERHVQLNLIYDVQCMLLWSEWVRTFRNRASLFPKLILEKEFRDVILNSFGVEIVNDEFRGAVYSGLHFVP